jgi:hypothetical protein
MPEPIVQASMDGWMLSSDFRDVVQMQFRAEDLFSVIGEELHIYKYTQKRIVASEIVSRRRQLYSDDIR